MSTLRENLAAVRALIAKGWTQGAYARDASGCKVTQAPDYRTGDMYIPKSESIVVSYCVIGAVREVAGHEFGLRCEMVNALESTGVEYLVDYNDVRGRTQAEVLAVIDRAIEAAP